jgi:hypothetical protein
MKRHFPPHAETMRYAVGALSPREQARAARLLRTLGTGAAARRNSKEATHADD